MSSSAISQMVTDSYSKDKVEAARYLEATEIDYFLKVLVREVLTFNPEDPIAFAVNFFRRVRNCTYITNRDLSFIRESQYNRGSFIIVCRAMFAKFPSLEVTIFDFFNIIDLCFQGFSVQYFSRVAFSLDPVTPGDTPEQAKYNVRHLLSSLEFFIYYESWMNELISLVSKSVEVGAEFPLVKKSVSLRILKEWAKSLRYELLVGPSKEILLSVADALAEQESELEIPIESIRRALLLNERVHEELSSKLPKVVMECATNTTAVVAPQVPVSGLGSSLYTMMSTTGISGECSSVLDEEEE